MIEPEDWDKAIILSHKLCMACKVHEKRKTVKFLLFGIDSRLSLIRFIPLEECWRCHAAVSGAIKAFKKDILCHFLTVERTVIPRHWQTPQILSLAEWVTELDSVMYLKHLIAADYNKLDQHIFTWTTLEVFQHSSEFRELFTDQFSHYYCLVVMGVVYGDASIN